MSDRQPKRKSSFDEVEIDPDAPIYTTGVVCRILKIPVWVLKQLDSAEIVSPERESENASRLYSKRELNKVAHCWTYMSKHKVKISGLKVILKIERSNFGGR